MIFINRRSSSSISMHDPARQSYSSIEPVASKWGTSLNKVVSTPGEQTQEKPVGKMLWGKPTWYMLHTLAEKIDPEMFPRLRIELLNVIMRICNNLPCPDCASHATAYLNRINFETIQTKEQLKLMLFQFHNSVNTKKKLAVFSYADLDSTYQHANTTNIITNFFHHFSKNTYSGRMGTENFHRTRAVRDIKGWLQINLQYFAR
jgi:hypothetical protein